MASPIAIKPNSTNMPPTIKRHLPFFGKIRSITARQQTLITTHVNTKALASVYGANIYQQQV